MYSGHFFLGNSLDALGFVHEPYISIYVFPVTLDNNVTHICPFHKPSPLSLFHVPEFGEHRWTTMVPNSLALQHSSMPFYSTEFLSTHLVLAYNLE